MEFLAVIFAYAKEPVSKSVYNPRFLLLKKRDLCMESEKELGSDIRKNPYRINDANHKKLWSGFLFADDLFR